MSRFRHYLAFRFETLVFLLFIMWMVVYPLYASFFGVLNYAYFLSFTFLSISLGLIWGYAGILSFGQTVFFGIGGYLYGVYTLNFTGGVQTWIGAVIAVAAGALVAALLGYFLFYGGVNDVFVGLTMLALTLVLSTFMGQTAGPKWAIGTARLNGYNGMFVPTISWRDGIPLDGKQLLYLHLILLVIVYILLRWVTNTRWGYGIVALRENRERTETFGYNVRFMQVQIFTISGALAALSGVLYASWGGYIDPSVMGMTAAITPVIYVAIGGRKSITAAILATMILMELSQSLASTAPEYAFVIFGTLALLAVLFVPEGFVFTLFRFVDSFVLDRLRKAPSRPAGQPIAKKEPT